MNSVRFVEPNGHTDTMVHINESTHLISSNEEHIREEDEEEWLFDDTVENTITEK